MVCGRRTWERGDAGHLLDIRIRADHYYKFSATLWPFVKPVRDSENNDVEIRGRVILERKMPAGVTGE